MAILKLNNIVFLVLIHSILSCYNPDGTITVVSPIEADTYISSTDSADHSDLDYLSVSRNGAAENRILVKLPTGQNDHDSHLDDCLGNPICFVFFMPIAILGAIIAPNCDDSSFTAANLNWAHLAFDTEDSSSPADGSLNIDLLGQAWWHDVSWSRAHPFTSQGNWITPGGSIDTSQTFDPNCTNLQGGQTCAAGEVKFDMTGYLSFMLNNPNSSHFGLVIRWPTDTAELRMISSQGGSLSGPRLVANYNCITTAKAETTVYRLGDQL